MNWGVPSWASQEYAMESLGSALGPPIHVTYCPNYMGFFLGVRVTEQLGKQENLSVGLRGSCWQPDCAGILDQDALSCH